MRSHACSQRPLDSRSAQQSACSCSYPIQPVRYARHERCGHHVAAWQEVLGRRPSSACGACCRVAQTVPDLLGIPRRFRQRRNSSRCSAAAEPGPGPDSVISGYTPANYISFSEDDKDVATHTFVIDVDAPANVCFGIWNDWNRLVEFLDLVAQIGLDVNNPDLALFQCFYRHGLLPVMEIVFVLQKTEVVPDKRIAFESVWGMPMSGSVTFKPLRSGTTRVKLNFSQALPDLLVDLKVGIFGVQNSLMPIFSENLRAFQSIAEAAARDPSSLPPRVEAGERAYTLFDEEADIALFEEIMENLEFDEDEEALMLAREDTEQQQQQQQGDDEEEEEGEELGSSGAPGRAVESSTGVLGASVRGGSSAAAEDSSESASSSQGGGQAAASMVYGGSTAGARRSSGRVAGSASASQDAEDAPPLAAASSRRPPTAGKAAGRTEPESVRSTEGTAASSAGTVAGSGGTRRRTARPRGAV